MLELVAVLLTVLSWLVAFFVPLPLKIPAVITLLLASIVGAVRAIGWLRRRRAAQAFERALSTRSDPSEIQRKLGHALDAIRRRGRAAHRLPWYVLIGPPGSGKSTAIRNSGLELPHEKDALRGLGGTRNCDAWLTNDAILLDTAGRWTSRDDDREEWLGFLDLLRRHRPQRPLDGLLCAIDLTQAGTSDEERADLARRLRDRIDEVQSRLQMSLPVYLVFTKADLVPGFVETFRALERGARDQIWGYTAALGDGSGARVFSERFDALVSSLVHRAPGRMQAERAPEDRALIHQFPDRVHALGPALASLIETVFFQSIYTETPRLRGVYFTSGAPSADAGSYFLREVFEQIVFRDSAIATRSPREIARQSRLARAAAAAIAVFALATGTLPALAWSRQRSYLEDTRAMVDHATQTRAAGPSPEMEALTARVVELRAEPSLGLYQPLREFLAATLRDRVVAPMIRADAEVMRADSDRDTPDARSNRAQYQRLELHLLLTRAEPGEPALDAARQSFVVDQLSDRWLREIPTYDHARRARARQALEVFATQLAENPALRLARDEDAVARTRRQLAAHDGLDYMLELIVDEVEPLGYDQSIRRIVGAGSTRITARRGVRGAFTRRGFSERVQPILERGGARWARDAWVLGLRPPASDYEASARMSALRERYFTAYRAEWRAFLDSVRVEVPSGVDATRALRIELRREEPFEHLVRATEEETNVTPEVARDFAGFVAYSPRHSPEGPRDSTRYQEWIDFLLVREGGFDYQATRASALADTDMRIASMDASWQGCWRALLLPALQAP